MPQCRAALFWRLVTGFWFLSSNHLAGERHDFHEVLLAQLAGDRAEDARAAGVVLGVDHHGRVLVEADVAAVGADGRLPGADDDAADDLALLDVAGGKSLLYGADDHG